MVTLPMTLSDPNRLKLSQFFYVLGLPLYLCNFAEIAEAKIFKFCRLVGHIKCHVVDMINYEQ